MSVPGFMDPNATTVAAIATPPGTGAVALIRMSGPRAGQFAEAVFRGRRRENWTPRQQHFGRIVDERGSTIDEVLLTYFPGPGSFTGEDIVEIATHGGVVVTNRVLERLLEEGAIPAEPGEFSRRAFFNGRIDLTQAEAIMDLISAQTELAAKAATEQLSGRLGGEIEEIRLELVSLIAHVEAYIDFPDEDIDPDSSDNLISRTSAIRERISRLLDTSRQGRILREGLRTVICGAPNAGKSSLLNVLLGFDRAIVDPMAGTTRDTIEEVINLRGIPVRLIDTAGIREDAERVERQGVERSRRQMETAELILLVIDSSAPADQVEDVNPPLGARVLRILNKSDLAAHPDWSEADGLRVSCLATGADESIRDFLYDNITSDGVDTASLMSINGRHQNCLRQARTELELATRQMELGESPEFIAVHLRDALSSIGDVVGKTDIEEILGEIFSTFCIGK